MPILTVCIEYVLKFLNLYYSCKLKPNTDQSRFLIRWNTNKYEPIQTNTNKYNVKVFEHRHFVLHLYLCLLKIEYRPIHFSDRIQYNQYKSIQTNIYQHKRILRESIQNKHSLLVGIGESIQAQYQQNSYWSVLAQLLRRRQRCLLMASTASCRATITTSRTIRGSIPYVTVLPHNTKLSSRITPLQQQRSNCRRDPASGWPEDRPSRQL